MRWRSRRDSRWPLRSWLPWERGNRHAEVMTGWMARLGLVILGAIALCGCDVTPAASTAPGCENDIVTCMEQRTTPPPTVIDPAKKYTATVHTSRGDFTIALVDPALAPQTVNNFVYLSQNHFYDGLTFHRVVPGFVVQGGDPLGNGTGGPAGMASSAAGVSGSQFFITIGDAPSLATSGVYNHFGQVTSGMDVIDSIRVGDRMTSIDISAS